MFKVDPDAIYTAKDLRKMTGMDARTLRRCFPLVQMAPPNGRVWLVSGRAILDTLQARIEAKAETETVPAPRTMLARSKGTVPLMRVREIGGLHPQHGP
jgi:hypothetical protein